MKLAKVLEKYLWAEKISQKDFAAQRGISASTLGRFLRGTHQLDGNHLAQLLIWLLGEDNEPTA
ncbi:hypothetical protein LCGC14_1320880 [marine sediment metagenome]|uniref:HTH cro/C1-type domain-containing protein n=1 Tax=marine sediment metagenome TaxID=412755 RepID=A0A0F9KK49_9ZZZZ